ITNDPATPEPLGSYCSCAGSTKEVGNERTVVGVCSDDALQESLGLLGRIRGSFLAVPLDNADVSEHIVVDLGFGVEVKQDVVGSQRPPEFLLELVHAQGDELIL